MARNSVYDDLRVFALGQSNHTKNYKKSVQRWFRTITDDAHFSFARHVERTFPDSVPYVKAEENVRGKDVYVISSLYDDRQCVENRILGESVSDKFTKLIFFCNSLYDASADRITVIIPYDGFSRQDRKTESRAPVYTKYVAQQIEVSHVARVLTMDIHNLAAFQNANRIQSDNLEAKNLFVDWCEQRIESPADDEYVVLSPDSGGMGRTRRFRDALKARWGVKVGIAYLDKERVRGEVHGDNIIGEVEGRKVFIIDDIIASGKSIAKCEKVLGEKGADLYAVFATHGLFVGQANKFLANIKRLVITDTVDPYRLDDSFRDRLEVLETSKIFAQAIRRTHVGDSLSELL